MSEKTPITDSVIQQADFGEYNGMKWEWVDPDDMRKLEFELTRLRKENRELRETIQSDPFKTDARVTYYAEQMDFQLSKLQSRINELEAENQRLTDAFAECQTGEEDAAKGFKKLKDRITELEKERPTGIIDAQIRRMDEYAIQVADLEAERDELKTLRHRLAELSGLCGTDNEMLQILYVHQKALGDAPVIPLHRPLEGGRVLALACCGRAEELEFINLLNPGETRQFRLVKCE